MTDVKGRTAFITGGANGIGLGIARAFARAGAKLALADLDATGLEKAKAELEKVTQVATVTLDVRDRDAFARAADRVEKELGPVSLLFNNAGVSGVAPVNKLTYELWDWVIGINLNGVINGVQTFLPRMLKRRDGGHIVNTASAAGLAIAGSGVMYASSKYAVIGISESFNKELEPFGIGTSVLCPGPVATDIVARTTESQPESSNPISEKQREQTAEINRQIVNWLHTEGVKPNKVGEMVLSGVLNNRLFILTDKAVLPFYKERDQAILEAIDAVAGEPKTLKLSNT